MNLSGNTVKKICAIIVFAGLVFFLVLNYQTVGNGIGYLWGIFIPFAVGGIIAFIANIPMRFFERTVFKKLKGRGFVRPLSMILTFLAVALVIYAVISVVVPQLGTTMSRLIKSANAFMPRLKEWADDLFKNNDAIRARIDSLNINMESITKTVTEFVKNGAGSAFNNVFSAARAVVSGIVSVSIGFVFACYLLAQKENLQRQTVMLMDAIFPGRVSETIKYIAAKCSDTFSNFISCQCLEACILGAMFLIVLIIAGMPYALLISVLIAFMSLIPVVGAFIGCGVGAFLILMESPLKAIIFIVIFLVLQQIEGNLIYPRVVGGRVGLPSMWVLVAVTVGSSLMGVAGMLFFIPLTSVIYSLIREWTYARTAKKSEA